MEIDNNRETVLVLRTCKTDMSSYGGFVWPHSGYVECTDWKETKECGNGLHGLLRGEGDGPLLSLNYSKWLVLEVYADTIVYLNGKVKFPFCWVIYAGDRAEATRIMREKYPNAAVVGGTATAGDGGTATAGYGGTATAGDGGTATAGHRGTATSGHRGTATAGYDGTATSGYGGTATAGDRGTATSGDYGTATAGDRGTATAGDGGTATAGYLGTATAGDVGTATVGNLGTATADDGGTATAGDGGTAIVGNRGTATAGDGGTATAGNDGIIIIRYWDDDRFYIKVSPVGYQDGELTPNVPYILGRDGEFVEKK